MLADPTVLSQREKMMMSVDEESCPSCDVIFVTLQFRSEDSIARSVAVCLGDVVGGENAFPKECVLKPEVVTLLRLIRTFTFELRSCVDRLACKRSVFFKLLLFL